MLVDDDEMVDVGVVVVDSELEEEEVPPPPPVLVPFPMLVVMGPLSMYTPEKYQSSGLGLLTILKTPRCQSSELVDVDAGTFCTTLTKGSEPCEAHKPTVPAVN